MGSFHWKLEIARAESLKPNRINRKSWQMAQRTPASCVWFSQFIDGAADSEHTATPTWRLATYTSPQLGSCSLNSVSKFYAVCFSLLTSTWVESTCGVGPGIRFQLNGSELSIEWSGRRLMLSNPDVRGQPKWCKGVFWKIISKRLFEPERGRRRGWQTTVTWNWTR